MTASEQLQKQQAAWFSQGATLELTHRIGALGALQSWIHSHEDEISRALAEDLGKAPAESYFSETGMVLQELRHTLRHLRRWAKPQTSWGPLSQFPSRVARIAQPRGTVLIISPWNYPIQLALNPLIGALAAGNTAVIKPSEYAPACARLLQQIAQEVFEPDYVQVVCGDAGVSQELTQAGFDLIFFTGSTRVGRQVMKSAAETLTPVVLELGGKSPCIVDATANLELAARRIVWGKLLNAGQTCVAPDYVLADNRIKEKLLPLLADAVRELFGDTPAKHPDYPHIVHLRAYERLERLIPSESVFWQGDHNKDTLHLAPVILRDVPMDAQVMQEEIFGPILPVIGYNSLEEAIQMIARHPNPLALYLFTEDKGVKRRILRECSFGGGCINDTIVHLATDLPFGGIRSSGIGAYHGKASFDTFSHYKTVLQKSTRMDLPFRYPPYTDQNFRMARKVLR